MSSVYVSLSLFNQGVYGSPFHVFSKSLFQLGSPLILVMAPELTSFSYSYFLPFQVSIEAFLLCFYFYQNLRVVPHGTKGTGPEFVTRPVYLRSQLRNNTNTVFTLVLLIHLLHVLCTRYTGIAHHRVLQTSGRGWADSKAVHGMECSGARSLYWRSLSAGAAACSVPYCQYNEVCSPTRLSA